MSGFELLQAIGYEGDIFLPVVRILREKGASWWDIMKFMILRVVVSTKYREFPILHVPDVIPIYNRYDLLAYRELFLLDDYRASLWVPGLMEAVAPLVLDVGANVGMFAALCRKINPGVRLRCFEMMPACAAIIARRLKAMGDGDFEVLSSVVMAGDGETVTIAYDSPFAPGNAVKRTEGHSRVQVSAISLDVWWRVVGEKTGPFVVKIDVEGSEGEVWKGGRKCITSATWVLIELHGHTLDGAFPGLEETHAIKYFAKKTNDMSVAILERSRPEIIETLNA